MAKLIDTDSLKDALTKFKQYGDSYWLTRTDAPELIEQVLGEHIDEAVLESIQSNIGGLTSSEVTEVIAEA